MLYPGFATQPTSQYINLRNILQKQSAKILDYVNFFRENPCIMSDYLYRILMPPRFNLFSLYVGEYLMHIRAVFVNMNIR